MAENTKKRFESMTWINHNLACFKFPHPFSHLDNLDKDYFCYFPSMINVHKTKVLKCCHLSSKLPAAPSSPATTLNTRNHFTILWTQVREFLLKTFFQRDQKKYFHLGCGPSSLLMNYVPFSTSLPLSELKFPLLDKVRRSEEIICNSFELWL